jgi:hypothetical protein
MPTPWPTVGGAGPPGRPAPRPQVLHDRQALRIVRGRPAGDLVERAHAAGAQTRGRVQPAHADAGGRDLAHPAQLVPAQGGAPPDGRDRGPTITAQATPGPGPFQISRASVPAPLWAVPRPACRSSRPGRSRSKLPRTRPGRRLRATERTRLSYLGPAQASDGRPARWSPAPVTGTGIRVDGGPTAH